MRVLFIILIILVLFIIYLYLQSNQITIKNKFETMINTIDQLPYPYKKNQIPVYYINMDKHTNRKQYMEEQLSTYFERYYRIPGVNGKLIQYKNNDIINGIGFFNEFSEMSLPEIGCTLSHLVAIKTAYENEEEVACIMEDDVYMNLLSLQDESLDQFMNKMNFDWEILQLFHSFPENLSTITKKINEYTLHLHQNGKYPSSSGCYIINRKGMKKILNQMGNNPFYLKKSMSMKGVSDWILYDQVKTWIINQSLVITNNIKLKSTIGSSEHDSGYDNFLLNMSYNALQKYKDKINEINKISTPVTKLFYNLYMNDKPKLINLNINIDLKEPIPKIIYRTWCYSQPIGFCGGRKANKLPLEITNKSLPDWKEKIYSDDDIIFFLENEFGNDHYITKAYHLINPKYGASRSDLFRYLVIYKYGGLYLDIKSCVTDYLPNMPENKDIWISSWASYNKAHTDLFPDIGEYQNWYIYARKHSPILKDIIEQIVHNIYELYENCNSYKYYLALNRDKSQSKSLVLSITGPIAMTFAINKSKYKNSVIYDNSINKYIKYDCNNNIQKLGKDHYSMQTKTTHLVVPKNKNYIPKIVYMTYYDLDRIPEYVKNNIQKYCSGYEIKLYDDNMCIEFLNKYYGKSAIKIYNNMKIGAHKADFWRFCILYLFGGYYFDIKTDFQVHIDDIFNINLQNSWYTVLNKNKNSIYNGIIVTPSMNPILLEIIQYIYKHQTPFTYYEYIDKLYNIIQKNCNKTLHEGYNIQKNNWNCVLFQEECDSNCKNNCDRYGLQCIIKYNNKIIFNTRYKDFPWKKTYISMTTIPERLEDKWFFNNIKRTISLLKINQILILNIPFISLKGKPYIIPTYISSLQNNNFRIYYCDRDEGPITKLLPILRNNDIKDDEIIIICDDDIVYKEKVFDLLEQSVLDNINKVSQMCTSSIQGFQSFAFQKKLLKGLLNVNIPESCIKIDDDVIQSYITHKNIKIIKVLYDNDDNWTCSFNQKETDTHPNWTELNKIDPDRSVLVKKCLKDIIF